MAEQKPDERLRNFDEVAPGFSEAEAHAEVKRCLQCKLPGCVAACPLNVNIPGFIRLLGAGKREAAAAMIMERNLFPELCGRACPSLLHCEGACRLRSRAVAIAHLERFASAMPADAPPIASNGKSVAVVGSGASGLSASARLASKGYEVLVYEALHEPGGALRCCIPAFRLPKKFVEGALQKLKALGVELRTNIAVGRTVQLSELEQEHDAVLLATGALMPRFPGLPGQNLRQVHSANEFLMRVNLMSAHSFPEHATPVRAGSHIVVIGCTPEGIDSARIGRRLGGAVTIVHASSQDDVLWLREEIRQAREEGIKFVFLTDAVAITGRDSVGAVECLQMKPGPVGEDGKRIPLKIDNSEFALACDMVIIALGSEPSQIIPRTTDIRSNAKGGFIVQDGFQTSRAKVFAAGRAVNPGFTITEAMAHGRKAADEIDEFLRKVPGRGREQVTAGRG